MPLLAELHNLKSDREGFPYIEVTAAYGDRIFYTKGAIPMGSIYGTVDGSYQYNFKTKEIVTDIQNEATQRVMGIVMREEIRYILRIYNLAQDEREPILEDEYIVTPFDPEREGVEALGATVIDASDRSYLFISYPESSEEGQPSCFLNIVESDQYRKIASEIPLERAFISGNSLLLVVKSTLEEAMRDEPQKILSLTFDELVQDKIERENFENRIQTVSYDIAYPKPTGNGAFLGLISSEDKFTLRLIKADEDHVLTNTEIFELDNMAKFIPLDENE